MRSLLFGSVIAALVLAAAVWASGHAVEKKPKNVILIGWDGAGRKNIKEGLAAGELPNLKKLAGQGSLVGIDILRQTDTKAGWTQILTGYEPENTGVFSNTLYKPIPRGYSVFERLEKYFGPKNIVTAAVISKTIHMEGEGPKKEPIGGAELKKLEKKCAMGYDEKKLVYEDGEAFAITPAKPYHTTREGMDVFINGLKKDKAVGAMAMELLQKYKAKPFFFFVHFGDADSRGHTFGEGSQQYRDAIISADTWTGKIMDKLEELNLYDDTLIYVTADHGFDTGKRKHRDAPYVFLATNDKTIIRKGERADIAPTMLERFGIDLDGIDPPLDGYPLSEPMKTNNW
ncbi:MAG: alkaline phosphatase family protein [Pseudomonadota bacterium]